MANELSVPYEKQAMNGDEMPDDMAYPDQLLYQQLRLLYQQFKAGSITRDIAKREKARFLREYECYKLYEDMGKRWVEIIKQTELNRAECRKNPSEENTIKLINIIEGKL